MASWQLLDGLHRSVAPIPTALRVSLSTVARFDCWGRGMPRLQLAFYCSDESLSAVTQKGGGGGEGWRYKAWKRNELSREDERIAVAVVVFTPGVFFPKSDNVSLVWASTLKYTHAHTHEIWERGEGLVRKWDTKLLIPKGLELFREWTETVDRYGQTKGSNHLYKKERNEKVRPRRVEILKKQNKKEIRERFCTYTLCL